MSGDGVIRRWDWPEWVQCSWRDECFRFDCRWELDGFPYCDEHAEELRRLLVAEESESDD